MFERLKKMMEPPPPPPIGVLVEQQLDEARRDLLSAQKEREYWNNMVTAMEQRVSRLTRHQGEQHAK